MQENKIFEALLDVIPFAAYAVDINTYEVVYANKLMSENMYAPREEFCWKKIHAQEEVCAWCTIPELKERDAIFKNEKLTNSFFDEVTDCWFQSYDELIKWPDGRTVKYSILVDITEQKEIQANMIKNNTKLAIQGKKLKEANDKLEYMAKKDFLTGLNNRGHFFTLVNKFWDRKLIDGDNIYVTMIDIDHFKRVNDQHGHKAGDEVLKAFAQVVLKYLNENDLFGRIGGEEFALITISNNKKKISSKLEKIRKDIENIVIKIDSKEIKITASFGVSKKEMDEQIDIVLDRADKELYKAKEGGRNRVKFRI